ncbi:glyoxalase [Frisingicoccus sp.]|uniref:glyoxalase n=1 Tax=Frisingicoccus sp. TaxID=1918627 RepID=UPI003AB20D7B
MYTTSLQEKKLWETFIDRKVVGGGNDAELYFEENHIDEFLDKLDNSTFDIEYLNRCKEHDWGQRVIRLYDPDRHVIEVGEEMEYVARRFLKQGMTAEQTAKKTQLPLSRVEVLIEDV